MLSTITLSSSHLYFPKQTKEIFLTITNNSQNMVSYFKTKTTKLNVYEVKPSKGVLQPLDSKQMCFKILKEIRTPEDAVIAQNKDKFMLEFLSIDKNNSPKNKEELSEIWVEKKKNHDKGFEVFTLPIKIQHDEVIKTAMSQTSSVKKIFKSTGALSVKEKDYESKLSQNYQNLKEEEEKLVQQRQSIFKTSKQEGKKSKSSIGSYFLLLIGLLLGFLVGNFLKMRVLV